MDDKQVPNEDKRIVKYRVQLEKRIEINKSYSERRNRAVAIRMISYGLFGKKRYQNIYLTCSLNHLYFALLIANLVHTRVAELSMIVRFETVKVLEHYEEVQGKPSYVDKEYSRIVIKLTTSPTQQDKKQAGYNEGFKKEDITNPLEIMTGRKDRERRGRGNRENRQDRQDRRGREDKRGKEDKRDQKDKNYPKKEHYNEGQKKIRHEKYQNGDRQYQRGEKKTRGTYQQKIPQNNDRNRSRKEEDRGDRRPRNNKNRYDEDY